MSLYPINPDVFAKDPIVSVVAKKIPSPSTPAATANSQNSSPLILSKLERAKNTTATPTTTPLEDLINHIRLRAAGQPSADEGLIVFNLAAGDFEYFKEILRQDTRLWGFFENKCRYDYNYHTYIFTARMPGVLHERLLSSITQSIFWQLFKFKQDQDNYVAQVADKVEWGSSFLCRWEGKKGFEEHNPDAVWMWDDRLYPNVIIEVSHSQKTKDLASLADFYIVGSGGLIKKVIGIDILYRQPKKTAVFSVWEPKWIFEDNEKILTRHTVVESQVFRDELGNSIQDPENVLGLELMLKDFNDDNSEESARLTQTIKISLEDLHLYLQKAQLGEKVAKETPHETYVSRREGSHTKRFARSLSRETLLPEDEMAFEESERQEVKRYEREDKAYYSHKRKEEEVLSRDERQAWGGYHKPKSAIIQRKIANVLTLK